MAIGNRQWAIRKRHAAFGIRQPVRTTCLLPIAYCLAAAALAAGCAKDAPPDPDKLALPLAALMVPPEEQMAIPTCEADPDCRAGQYYAPHRFQCGGFRDGQIGLQRYVYSLHNNQPPATWLTEVKR